MIHIYCDMRHTAHHSTIKKQNMASCSMGLYRKRPVEDPLDHDEPGLVTGLGPPIEKTAKKVAVFPGLP